MKALKGNTFQMGCKTEVIRGHNYYTINVSMYTAPAYQCYVSMLLNLRISTDGKW